MERKLLLAIAVLNQVRSENAPAKQVDLMIFSTSFMKQKTMDPRFERQQQQQEQLHG